ncbi:MAG: MBL fold metallo-hydrolase [Dehalococcoidia bacterium]
MRRTLIIGCLLLLVLVAIPACSDSGKINKLEAQIQEQQAQIADLQSDMQNQETQITSLKYDLAQAQQTIVSLQADKDALTKDKADLQAQITGLASDKTNLQTQIDTLNSDKTSLQADVDSLREKVNKLQEALDGPSPPPPPSGILSVHFIDVGQGDSILIDLGETEILIDGGNRGSGVANLISENVDGALEAMVATHTDADHIDGLIDVLAKYQVKDIWLNGYTATSATFISFMNSVNAEGGVIHQAELGNTIQVGTLQFIVLNPAKPLFLDSNNNSIVLSLSYGDTDFLFMGDAEYEAEVKILAQTVVPVPHVEILKVGHHGSRTSSSPTFLEMVQPEVAIYMAGAGNGYGHPHPETISALQGIGAKVYGTDVNGTVIVTSDGTTYQIDDNKPSPISLEIVSVTNPAVPGANATLMAKTEPGAICTITVHYASGPSKAQGLAPKSADSSGNVSWTWNVGTNTTPGSWQIVITASLSGDLVTQSTHFIVGTGASALTSSSTSTLSNPTITHSAGPLLFVTMGSAILVKTLRYLFPLMRE